MAWLYSDGRLIVDTATEKDRFVQWEHRLTPAGVERIREAVVTMLDEPVSRPSRDAEAVIHYGDGIVYPKDSAALVRLLLDRSWLPDEYWVTESPSIYRAAWYLTCYEEGRAPRRRCDGGRPRPPVRCPRRAGITRVDRDQPWTSALRTPRRRWSGHSAWS